MAKNEQSREANQPIWFDGKSINEALFCDDFLGRHKIIYTNGAFFTPDGRVTDELPLRGEIFEELKCCAVSNIPRKISNIVELMKLAALDGGAYQDAADTLAVKARRARERKEERLQHEKNLRQGKKRVHAEKPAAPEPPAPQAPARPAAKRTSRPGSARRRQERPQRRTETSSQRFAGALPVKKGKGSRKKSGR